MLEHDARTTESNAPAVSRAVTVALLMVLLCLVSPSHAGDFESSWAVVESGTSEDLLTAAEYENQIWVFGTGGMMLNSSDNGVTWQIAESPTEYDIHHSDSGFGSLLVAGDSGLVLLKESSESEWLDISLADGVLVAAEADFLEKLIATLKIHPEEAKLVTQVISQKNRF